MLSKKGRKRLIIFSVIAILAFLIYRVLLPAAPNTKEIPNPLTDKATLSKNLDLSAIPTNEYKEAYFGDLHIHTKYSYDAFLGGTVSSPDDAYLFAKGNAINIFGQDVVLERPLDFAAVTDHSEFIGEMYSVQTPTSKGYYSLMGNYFRSVASDSLKAFALFKRMRTNNKKAQRDHMKFFTGFKSTITAWNNILDAAETHYNPGTFTTLAGYEFSFNKKAGHLHRNIIFRDMKVPTYPLSAIELPSLEQLWDYLEELTNQGATVLAIQHNSNLAAGYAFSDTMTNGQPMDQTYAKMRQKYEPLIEVHQAKGNSEVSAMFWKNDEFADFENHDNDVPYKQNYVRYALTKGLEHEEKLGTNPYKYGMIGSTDTHNATGGNTEENDEYLGNHTVADFTPKERRNRQWLLSGKAESGYTVQQALNPGGLAGVWATQNTREGIWDALKRKETFATSGNRIKVRFFAGYGYESDYANYDAMVKDGYEKGVPMGSDLQEVLGVKSQGIEKPTFILWAAKDPMNANLDRIQVIKGWYDNGELKEKIYDAIVSENGHEATVDLKTATYSKDKGAAELQLTWQDPDFDPTVRCYYYLRVLEIPTPRYNLYDEVRYNIPYPDREIKVIRERAWSSPIWYSPK